MLVLAFAFLARCAFHVSLNPLDPAPGGEDRTETVSGSLFPGDEVLDFALSTDGTRLVYTTRLSVRAVSLVQPGPQRILSVSDFEVANFDDVRFSDDGDRVLFRGVASGSDDVHLFSADFAVDHSAIQLSTVTGFLFRVTAYVSSPVGGRVVYSTEDYFGPHEVYSVSSDGSGAAQILSTASVLATRFNAGGAGLFYLHRRYDNFFTYPTRLYLSADPSSPPIEIAPIPASPVRTTTDFAVTPDESTVVFCRDAEEQFRWELYRTDVVGGPVVKLSDPLVANGDVSQFHLSPDATRAVYAADRDVDEVFELYAVPVDGSTPPVKLSGPMVAGGDVAISPFALPAPSLGALGHPLVWFTPNSTHVLYVADQQVNNRFDLWGAPLDGSSPAVRLSALIASGSVDQDPRAVKVSADGTRAVYRADGLVNNRFELFSVPLDGSGPPVPICGPIVAGGNVLPGFQLLESPPAVLFRADSWVNDQIELWLAPLDGSRPPTRRSSLAQPGGDVEDGFTVSPDGAFVYWLADALVDGRIELFRQPIERIPRARRR